MPNAIDSAGPKQCPKRRLLNDPTTKVCDCGYDFATGVTGAPRHPRPDRAGLGIARETWIRTAVYVIGFPALIIAMGSVVPANQHAASALSSRVFLAGAAAAYLHHRGRYRWSLLLLLAFSVLPTLVFWAHL
jgi:hypothetical protein